MLFLHLLRFQYDPHSGQVIKNNNFFEFTEHIDLTEYVREDEATSWKYTLFAVLSHCGSGSHGHYVAYINPLLAGKWLKFDDDTISVVHRSDAIDANFGSNDGDEWTKSLQLNAYMLVYVRDSQIDDIFAPVDPMYISDELRLAVQNDPEVNYYNNLKKLHYTTDVYVFLSHLLEFDFRFGIAKVARPMVNPKFAVTRDLTTNDFKKVLTSAFNISGDNQLRVWPILHSSSSYSHPVYIQEDAPFISALCDVYRNKYLQPYSVWVEMALPGTELPPFDPHQDVLVFYYYYCARECRPYYINHGYHNLNSKIDELIPVLNQQMDWSNRDLNIYQELRESKAAELVLSHTFSDYVQIEFNVYVMNVIFEPKDHDVSTKLNSIVLYFHDMMCRANLTICNDDNQNVEHSFDISLLATFPELLDVLAARLHCDRKKIQIFKCLPNRDGRGEPIPSSSTELLHVLLNCYVAYQKILLFYKLHRIDVSEVETRHNFIFQWMSIDTKKYEKLTLYLTDGETIASILTEAEQIINHDPTHGSGKFRVLRVLGSKLQLVKDSKEIYDYLAAVKAEGVSYYKQKFYRIEEIPKGDEILCENEKYVVVSPCSRYFTLPSKCVIFPFILKVNMTELWKGVKDRIRNRLDLSETMWGDYRPAVLLTDHVEVDIDDTKCLNEYEELLNSVFSICLNYKHKAKRTSVNSKLDISYNSLNFIKNEK